VRKRGRMVGTYLYEQAGAAGDSDITRDRVYGSVYR